jgi:M6 family metalloprotease-like protein
MKLLMKLFVFGFLIILIQGNYASGQITSYCPAYPYPFSIRQPDGTSLIIRLIGDERKCYTETEDGYTILKNDKEIFEYASLSSDNKLFCSGIKAKKLKERTANDISQLSQFHKNIRDLIAPSSNAQNTTSQQSLMTMLSFPTTGTRRLLVILIDFSDLPFTLNQQGFNDLMNQQNYNQTGSFRDYWLSNSFSTLTVNSTVYGWYHAPGNFASYGSPVIVNGVEMQHDSNPKLLVQQAIDAAENAGVNFADFDNDNDGTVDGVVIIHSGQGQEDFGSYPNATMAQASTIWSHRGTLDSYARTYDNKLINDYDIIPEIGPLAGVITPIGVVCHEFGHILGLPDLYNTFNNGAGIGDFDLMASGSWNGQGVMPSNLSAWCKSFLGWQQPTALQIGSYSLLNASENNVSYKITTSHTNEYFLLENRQHVGFDQGLPGTGLAIWHINTNKTTAAHIAANDVNNDVDLKGVDLEEADGLNKLDLFINRGNAGDLFPGSTNNFVFNDNSNPNSKTYSPVVTTNKPLANIIESTNSGGNHAIFFSYLGHNPITGASLLCSSSSYSITNLSSLFTITWNPSGNITRNSNQGSNPCIFSAAGSSTGSIGASINTGNTSLTLTPFNIWLGVPVISNVSGPRYSVVGENSTYFATISDVHENVTSFNWTLMPSVYNNFFNPGYDHCYIKWYRASEYVLVVNATNTCGTSSSYYFPITVGSKSYLSVSPNPATDNVQVSIIKPQNTLSASDTTSIAPNLVTTSGQDLETTYTIKIYNSFGTIFYSTKKSGDTFTIPVNNLQNGTYIIEANDGKQSYTQQLIVKH